MQKFQTEFKPGLYGEAHPDKIQKCYVQQEHHYPPYVIQPTDGLKEIFHCKDFFEVH